MFGVFYASVGNEYSSIGGKLREIHIASCTMCLGLDGIACFA